MGIPVTTLNRLRMSGHAPPDLPVAVIESSSLQGTEHCHDFYELVFIRSGCGVNLIEGRPYPMLGGDVLLMRPDDVHSFRSEPGFMLVNVIFTPELFANRDWAELIALPGLNRFLDTVQAEVPHKLALAPDDARTADRLCRLMLEELTRKQAGFHTQVRAQMTEFLVLLARAQAAYGGSALHSLPASGPITEALAILHRDFRTAIRVADLAAAVGLTPNWFGEQFRQRTGLGVLDYLARLRVEEARRLIETDRRPLLDLALEVGFSDPGFFTRLFRRITGMTPRAYRALVRTE